MTGREHIPTSTHPGQTKFRTKFISGQNLLLQVLKTPVLMRELDINGWNQVLADASQLKLRGRLAHDAQNNDLWDHLPAKVRHILTNAKIEAQARQRRIMWEVNRVRRALIAFEDKVILVKGGGLYRTGARLRQRAAQCRSGYSRGQKASG